MHPNISITPVLDDPYLKQLFSQIDTSFPAPNPKPKAVVEWPSNYDPLEINKDYESEQQKHRPIRKNKKKVFRSFNTRSRKESMSKMYIEMLQDKVMQLQNQIKALKKTLKNNSPNNQVLQNQIQEPVPDLISNRQKYMNNITQMMNQSKIDEKNISQQFSKFSLRQGASGKDRIKVINHYFKQISEIILPDLEKYIIKTAQEEQDLFSPNNNHGHSLTAIRQQVDKNTNFDLKLTRQQLTKINQIKYEIKEEKTKLEFWFEEFYRAKKKIVEVSSKIQMVYFRLFNNFSSREIATFLCRSQQYKFVKGFSIQGLFSSIFAKLQQEQKQYQGPKFKMETEV